MRFDTLYLTERFIPSDDDIYGFKRKAAEEAESLDLVETGSPEGGVTS